MSLAPHPRQSPADLESPFAAEPALEGRNSGETAFLFASRRTRLAFQRTRMSADRTLMAIVRTALSLISFGFTIYHFFGFLRQSAGMARVEAARNLSVALVSVGILMLVLGIVGHVSFMLELRADHGQLVQARLIPHDRFPYSVTLAVALLLLLIGLLAVISMVVRTGPFR
jgi:inner membrane protein YidH